MKNIKNILLCQKHFLCLAFFCLVFPALQSQTLNINPNPFIQRTLASFTLAGTDSVSLQLINSLGQVIVSPVSNTVLPAGNYQDSLILDNYPPGTYFLILKVKSGSSKTMKLIKQGPVGINELNLNASIKLFPNPVKDKLSLQFESTLKIDVISISNALGQMIYSMNDPQSKQEIDLGFLQSGIYFLTLRQAQGENKTGQKVFKVVKE